MIAAARRTGAETKPAWPAAAPAIRSDENARVNIYDCNCRPASSSQTTPSTIRSRRLFIHRPARMRRAVRVPVGAMTRRPWLLGALHGEFVDEPQGGDAIRCAEQSLLPPRRTRRHQ